MGFTDVFGGANVNPAQLSYSELDFSADTTLQWNIPGTTEGLPTISAKMKLVPSAGSLSVIMPDATLVTVGQDVLFINDTAFAVTLKAADGATVLGTIAPGTSWFFWLEVNSTANGAWGSTQFGAGTSVANAAILAGLGLYAAANTLNQQALESKKNANYAVAAADRASTITSTGGAIAFTFASSAVLTNGWFAFFKNNGSGTLTLTASGGQTIDGAATKLLAPGESCILVADGVTSLDSIGYGRSLVSSTTATIVNSAGTGDIALTASQIAAVVQTFTGAITGDRTITYGGVVGYWFVYNNTTGAHLMTYRVNNADPGVAVTQGNYAILRSDGTTMAIAFTATSGTVTNIATGAGLTGGPIVGTGTIAMTNSGVTLGTYGDSSHSLTLTIDVLGRITSAAANVIAAAWGSLTGIPAAIAALASVTPAADFIGYFTGATTAAVTAITAYGRSLIAAANAAAARVLITPLTTNGDLWTYAGGIDARLAVGASGTFLASNGTLPGYRAITQNDLGPYHNFITNLIMSTSGGTAIFTVKQGQATDATNAYLMTLPGALDKTTSAWSLGNNGGSLDAGVIAINSWYDVLLITRPDTGVSDILTTLAGVGVVTLPANYTLYRRIGSIQTDGASHWKTFFQIDDTFYTTPNVDFSSAAPTGLAVRTLSSVPYGSRVGVLATIGLGAGGGGGTSLQIAPGDYTTSTVTIAAADNSIAFSMAVPAPVMVTNVLGQLNIGLSSAAGSGAIFTVYGWIDDRGQNAN